MIAKKTQTEDAWMAWVPIANIILMLKIPNMSLLWIIAAFLIPVIFVPVVYCRIAEER